MPVASSFAAALLGASLAASSPEPLLRLQDPALLESSGLVVSAVHEDVLWSHADGGSVAEVRAVDAEGRTVAVLTLAGIDPYDPEALAPGVDEAGKPALFLGDIGDNFAERPDVSVFRFREADELGDSTVDASWFRFTYPDGPHDAEALLVHPRTGRILIATKEASGGGLYRAPADPVTADAGPNRLVRVADVPSFVTDGAYLPDGRYALRTYGSVFLYDRPGHQVGAATLPLQRQGESLAVDSESGTLLVGSEGPQSPVYAVPVPDQAAGPTPGVEEPGSGSNDDEGRSAGTTADQDDSTAARRAYQVARVVGILVVLAGILAVLRRSRGRPRTRRR